MKGVDEIRAGHYKELESPEDFHDFAEKIIAEGRRKKEKQIDGKR